ncbi:MAG: bifunctional oligoribonuclease/PAP phosphatase NrnA [Oscillospiraceae bacterium]
MITIDQAVKRLLDNDDILIITHKSPDGDTLGCAFSLYLALCSFNKNVRVECSDAIPTKFNFLQKHYQEKDFTPKFVVAVDVAAVQLLGKKLSEYADKIDLCIDHHPSNDMYAKETFVDKNASAACEIMFEVIFKMGITITKEMADCLYTGIATDSGCFKFSNTTAKTHRIAAELFELGCDYEVINRNLFENKSKKSIQIEQKALDAIEYFFNDQVAIIEITQKMVEETGANETELDGISSIPRTIDGVEIGITMREQNDGSHKISIRTACKVDASKLCAVFGGGGHKRAAGCLIKQDYETTKAQLLEAIKSLIEE